MDLDCLEPSIYLNDRVIDFYLTYKVSLPPPLSPSLSYTSLFLCRYLWYNMLETGLRERVHIFSSFFHQRLMDSTRDLTGRKERCSSLSLSLSFRYYPSLSLSLLEPVLLRGCTIE